MSPSWKPEKPAGGSSKGAAPYGKSVSAAAKARNAARKAAKPAKPAKGRGKK